MTAGYIKVFRQLMDWEWYKDANVFKLFVHCLLRANHIDNKWRGIIIKKGSFVTSLDKLAFETGLTKKQVRLALDKLKRTREVAHEGHSQYSIITVKNWNKFQAEGTQEGTQRALNNNDKNKEIIKEEREKIKKDFDLFFSEYPLQFDEYKTFTLYSTLINEKIVTHQELMQGVESYKKYIAAKKQTKIKFPYNWLKDMSWKNKYEQATHEKKGVVKNETPYRYNAFA